MLLESAIEWARNQPNIDWIDLGLFSDNPGAQALYARRGFRAIGRTANRFRVDGQSLDEILMTLNVLAATSDCDSLMRLPRTRQRPSAMMAKPDVPARRSPMTAW